MLALWIERVIIPGEKCVIEPLFVTLSPIWVGSILRLHIKASGGNVEYREDRQEENYADRDTSLKLFVEFVWPLKIVR